MASPFPGMDPYLESPENWRGFHHHLAEEIITVLNQELSNRYFAEVEVHTISNELGIGAVDMSPDAAILEVAPIHNMPGNVLTLPAAPHQRTAVVIEQTRLRAVHIYVSKSKRLVTTVELLSPFNKRGDGLDLYRQKRRRILLSAVHFIEIDLLRGGLRPGWEVNDPPFDTDYILLVNRAGYTERTSEIWDVSLNERLPVIPVPLLNPDPDIALDLQQIIENIYVRIAYARRIDYTQPVPPPVLRPAMQRWLAQQK